MSSRCLYYRLKSPVPPAARKLIINDEVEIYDGLKFSREMFDFELCVGHLTKALNVHYSATQLFE